MSDRDFDVILFGATGFTGTHKMVIQTQSA